VVTATELVRARVETRVREPDTQGHSWAGRDIGGGDNRRQQPARAPAGEQAREVGVLTEDSGCRVYAGDKGESYYRPREGGERRNDLGMLGSRERRCGDSRRAAEQSLTGGLGPGWRVLEGGLPVGAGGRPAGGRRAACWAASDVGLPRLGGRIRRPASEQPPVGGRWWAAGSGVGTGRRAPEGGRPAGARGRMGGSRSEAGRIVSGEGPPRKWGLIRRPVREQRLGGGRRRAAISGDYGPGWGAAVGGRPGVQLSTGCWRTAGGRPAGQQTA
jgi:hypothetical protein